MSAAARSGSARSEEPFVIACAYPDGVLTGPWFRAAQRVRRTIRRGGYWARVELVPASDLPARVDVLVVSPELAALAARVPAGGEVLEATPDGLRTAFDALADRLVRDGRLRQAPAPSRAVAVHRGFQALGDRGRLVGD